MKVAICMSGLVRTFKKCYQSYLDNIINHYDCDVFAFVSKSNNVDDIDLIDLADKVIVESDPVLDEKDYKNYKANKTRFYSIQGWLQQFWKIKMCHDMMLNYQEKNNIKYDWVIRCRPDLIITRKIDDLTKLDKNYIYVPVFPPRFAIKVPNCYDEDYVYNYSHNNGYMPDQFAIGSVDLMSKYAARHDDLDKILHMEKIHAFCAEHALGRQLNYHNVKVKFLQPLINIKR